MRLKDRLFMKLCNVIGMKYVKRFVVYIGIREGVNGYFLESYRAIDLWYLRKRVNFNKKVHNIALLVAIISCCFGFSTEWKIIWCLNIPLLLSQLYLVLLQKQHLIRIMQIAEAKRIQGNKRKTFEFEIGEWDMFFDLIEEEKKKKKKIKANKSMLR
ncbi:hypothetical protein bcgnr5369_57000 [Bacillus cereus]|uniref:Uncharacterized protein n=1 Tax=Bacillus thuringiensis TaxID=1428 RepID=A0A9X6WRH1_BACTU|nr:hypothetical protein [Bacillus thuringiensis]PFJ42737.1 hypothetical protein COJ15_05185 [Bacillus thuringiensis]